MGTEQEKAREQREELILRMTKMGKVHMSEDNWCAFCLEWEDACRRLMHAKKSPPRAGTWLWAGSNVKRTTASGHVFKMPK